MNNSLAATITTGLNDPNCAFFVGQMLGEFMAFKIIIMVAILGFLIKLIDKLAWEPLVEWIKKKLHKKRVHE